MKKPKKVKTSGLRKFVRAFKNKAKPAARVGAQRKPGAAAAAKPKLQPLAPALGKLVDDKARAARMELLKFKLNNVAERAELLKIAPRPADTRWPAEVRVGNRYRKYMGDLDSLARSIERRTRDGKPGLLQPIGLTPKDELIWGERRLEAWKRSSVALTHPIPVRVVDVLAIEGEWIENDPALRQNFTPSEAVEIVRAMRPKQREQLGLEAAERATSSRAAPGRKAEKGAAAGRVADRAAKFAGKSRNTINKAEAVVTAAQQDPDRYGGLVEDMDRTGRVDGPFRRLQIMQQTDARKAAPPAMPDGGPWEVVVIDFPWPNEPDMSQEEIDAAGRSLRPYPAMAIGEGVTFLREQVAPRLAKKVAVYFWTTGFHMPYAAQLLEAIGFTRSSTIATWVKDKVGRGRILRDEGEFCIFRHRGGVHIALTDDTTVWQGEGWQTRENSRKPAAFWDLVRRKHPGVRILSVFSTGGEGDDVDCYGDQVGKHAPAAAGDEEAEWKALGAIEAGVTVEGPIVAVLRERALVDAIDGKLALTIAGADRLNALDAKFSMSPTDLPAENRDELLWTVLDAVDTDPTTALEPDWLAVGGLLEGLVSGKKSRKLTARGRKRRDEVAGAMLPDWLEAAQAGTGPKLPGSARELLHGRRYVSGITAKHLTRSGQDLLAELREDRALAAELAGMPADFDALVPLYRQAQHAHHDAVLRNDGGAVEAAQARLDAIEKRANDLRKQPDGSFDWDEPSGRDRLMAATRAPVGEVPMWAQQGVFRIEIAGMPALVRYEPWLGGSFGMYAEDGARPFISDTGFRSIFGDDPALGCTVAQQAETFLREDIETPLNKGGSRREARKPKDKLPLPRTWHRMPASWDEVDEDDELMPVAGGEGYVPPVSPEWEAAFRGEKSSPADEPQPAGRADEPAREENENLYRCPQEVIDAIGKLGGHTVSMTIDWGEGENGTSVATCACGWVSRADRTLIYSGHNVQERATEAHWREVLRDAGAKNLLIRSSYPLPAPAPPVAADDYPEMPPELRIAPEAAE